jgi:hypothetical protein
MATLTIKKDFVIWNNGNVSIKDIKLTRDQVLKLSVKDMARYANYRLKKIGSDPWFRVTAKGVYDLTTNIPAIGSKADFYNSDNVQEFYDMLLDCNYEGTDLNGQLFNDLCD